MAEQCFWLGYTYKCSPFEFLNRTFDEIAACLEYTERVLKAVNRATREKD